MKKRRLYSDIDGVYNPFHSAAIGPNFPYRPDYASTGWSGSWREDKIHRDVFESLPAEWGDWFYLHWSEELIQRLNALALQDEVEIVWLSTWRERIPTHFCTSTGVEGADWRILSISWEEIVNHTGWWKHDLIIKDLEENPAEMFAWVDDELAKPRYANAVEWAHSQPGGLVVAPTPEMGLTRYEWESIEEHLLGTHPGRLDLTNRLGVVSHE